MSDALRLADLLCSGERYLIHTEAAAELRRLDGLVGDLVEALQEAAGMCEIASNGGGVNFYLFAKDFREVLAKAEGKV